MTSTKIKRSDEQKDIEKVMTIVASFGGAPKDLVAIRDYLSNEFEELGKNRHLYLLEDRAHTIGMVQLILKNVDNDLELANGNTIAHVHSLQVAKDQHRKGFGILIMQQLEEEALRLGLNCLTLAVEEDNEKAIGLYRKLGYKILKEAEGKSPEVKLFYMRKFLDAAENSLAATQGL